MGKSILKTIESIKLSKSRKFHIDTKISDFESFKKTPYASWPEVWKRIYYKAYPRFEQVILPNSSSIKLGLQEALIKRESCRSFSKAPIKLPKFSDLLFYSAGLKAFIKKDSSAKRFYPSAGARYPLEIYPFVFKVEKLNSGIYHYHLKTHSLETILREPFSNEAFEQFNQLWIRRSATLLVVSAVFARTETKYKDRGYRHILTEYGHIAQNFYLVSTALNLGCCSIGGFNDDGLNKLLDIDGIEESVIGVIAIGNKG